MAGVLESLYQRLHYWFKIQNTQGAYSQRASTIARHVANASLSDMGITRAQAEQEARRMDLPETRPESFEQGNMLSFA